MNALGILGTFDTSSLSKLTYTTVQGGNATIKSSTFIIVFPRETSLADGIAWEPMICVAGCILKIMIATSTAITISFSGTSVEVSNYNYAMGIAYPA